jgi:hypothetical protein
MDKKEIEDVQRFQVNVSRVLFEQTLEYILWKIENYKTLDELKKAVLDELKKIHKRNMKYLEDIIHEEG